MKEKLDFIIPRLELNGKLKVWATCSDDDPENEKVAAYLTKTYPNIRHLYDNDHIVKNGRNNLLRNTLSFGGQTISVNSLRKPYKCLNSSDLKLKWNSIRPKNILKWKPVKDLLLVNVKLLLEQGNSELQTLGE